MMAVVEWLQANPYATIIWCSIAAALVGALYHIEDWVE